MVWLIYCGVISARHDAWETAAVFGGASLVMYTAVGREIALAEERDYAAGLSRTLARIRKDQP